jgi:hypothetical protein
MLVDRKYTEIVASVRSHELVLSGDDFDGQVVEIARGCDINEGEHYLMSHKGEERC